ncbi:MAG: hypothetical protein HYX60_11905 [Legionella longbeachae]|nr:hypothetical protein [Legionella longbeachae]
MKTSHIKELPELHYIWVGPPSPQENIYNKYGREVKGHSSEGVIKMAEINKSNPIYFWCLDAHQTAFKEIFEKYPNIKIVAIDEYIEDKITSKNSDISEAARKMKEIFDASLIGQSDDQEEKNAVRGDNVIIRHRITVKNAFSLFLHVASDCPIYTMDTNIKPIKNIGSLSLPNLNCDFQLPAIYTGQNKILDNFENSLEWWAFFSSGKNNFATEIFNKYHQKWSFIEEYNEDKKTSGYQQVLANAMLESLTEVLMEQVNDNNLEEGYKFKKNVGSWEITWPDKTILLSETVLPVGNLKIEKYYYNTHKAAYLDHSVMAKHCIQKLNDYVDIKWGREKPQSILKLLDKIGNFRPFSSNFFQMECDFVNLFQETIALAKEELIKNEDYKFPTENMPDYKLMKLLANSDLITIHNFLIDEIITEKKAKNDNDNSSCNIL